MFNSNEIISVFLATPLAVAIIYYNRHTVRFHLKKVVARLLIKLRKPQHLPDADVDKLQVFSDHDEWVKFIKFKSL